MKKSEIINILKPYWLEYLKNNGESERKLQMEKFVDSFNELTKFSFNSLLNIDKYFSFISSKYILLGKFWVFSKTIAELKKAEMGLDDFKLKFKDHLTAQEVKEIGEKKIFIQNEFNKKIKEYFECTLGSQEREIRLWSAYVVFKYINQLAYFFYDIINMNQ